MTNLTFVCHQCRQMLAADLPVADARREVTCPWCGLVYALYPVVDQRASGVLSGLSQAPSYFIAERLESPA